MICGRDLNAKLIKASGSGAYISGSFIVIVTSSMT